MVNREAMGPKTLELVEILSLLATFLEEQDEKLWQNWVLDTRKRLLSSDYSGIEKLLSAYGGMGSFNDLVVGYYLKDGVFHQREGYVSTNETLSGLRTRAWDLATKIKHDVDNN